MEDERFRTIGARRTYLKQWRAILDPLAKQHAVDELVARLGEAGVPAGRVNAKADLASDRQVIHNGTLQTLDHPGCGPLKMPRAAALFSHSKSAPPAVAAGKGQHTREILLEIGKDHATIDKLYADGAVA